jgi:integrase/recombinase XerD
MKPAPTLPALIERFFTERLMRQRRVSSHTIASYRDTFRLLLEFVHVQLKRPPSNFDLGDLDAPMISAFLDDIERRRSVCARTHA